MHFPNSTLEYLKECTLFQKFPPFEKKNKLLFTPLHLHLVLLKAAQRFTGQWLGWLSAVIGSAQLESAVMGAVSPGLAFNTATRSSGLQPPRRNWAALALRQSTKSHHLLWIAGSLPDCLNLDFSTCHVSWSPIKLDMSPSSPTPRIRCLIITADYPDFLILPFSGIGQLLI